MESYVMNYYRNIDRDKVQFDFITHTKLDCSFENEILQNGGRVYKFPVFSMKNMPNLLQQIEEFFWNIQDIKLFIVIWQMRPRFISISQKIWCKALYTA